MKVLIDIGHPAHAHFFKNPIKLLQERGHHIIVTSRDKEFAVDLLDEMHISHYPLSRLGKGGLFSLAKELIQRDISLYKIIKKHNIEIMAAIGGVSISHITRVTGIPSLVFYDTENAKLQNIITYPFASQVIVPRCYHAWLPKNRNLRYDGYHELSYLHPAYFLPNKQLAIKNGLAVNGDTFFIRVVSWQASHDVGEQGWDRALLERVVSKLASLGRVIISSETPLPGSLQAYAYRGNLSEVHHVLAYSKAFVGESATMASESAVLGVPAIYAAETGRGYTDEQEHLYGLVRNLRTVAWNELNRLIDEVLKKPRSYWQSARQQLLKDTIDVARFIVQQIETFPEQPSLNRNPVEN